MYCTKCGAKIEDGNLFCPDCGARLDEGTKRTGNASGSKIVSILKNKFFIIGAIAVVAVAVLLIVLLSGKKDAGLNIGNTPEEVAENYVKLCLNAGDDFDAERFLAFFPEDEVRRQMNDYSVDRNGLKQLLTQNMQKWYKSDFGSRAGKNWFAAATTSTELTSRDYGWVGGDATREFRVSVGARYSTDNINGTYTSFSVVVMEIGGRWYVDTARLSGALNTRYPDPV